MCVCEDNSMHMHQHTQARCGEKCCRRNINERFRVHQNGDVWEFVNNVSLPLRRLLYWPPDHFHSPQSLARRPSPQSSCSTHTGRVKWCRPGHLATSLTPNGLRKGITGYYAARVHTFANEIGHTDRPTDSRAPFRAAIEPARLVTML